MIVVCRFCDLKTSQEIAIEIESVSMGSIVGRGGSTREWEQQIETDSGASVQVRTREKEHTVHITGTCDTVSKAIAAVKAAIPQFDRCCRMGASKYRCLLPPNKAFKVREPSWLIRHVLYAVTLCCPHVLAGATLRTYARS